MMYSRTYIAATATALFVSAIPGMAAALPIEKDSEASLSEAGGGLSFESFEGFPASAALDLAFVTTAGFTMSADLATMSIEDGTHFVTARLETTPDPGSSVVFTFGAAITDFAVSMAGINTPLIGNIVFSTNASESFTGVTPTEASSGGGDGFFGVIDASPFTVLTITSPNSGDRVAFDSVYFTAPVPEPTTLALLALGLAGFGFRRRLH